MTTFVALPLLVTLAFALVGSRRFERLPPRAAARCDALVLTAIIVAAVPTLWLIGLSGLAHLGFHNPVLDWSRHLLPEYRPLGAVVGMGSMVVAVIGTVRATRVLIVHRRIRCTDTRPLHEIDTDQIFAYTLPGPAGTVAVSRGLRTALNDDEFAVVVAHERAHADHRHDRMLLLALVAKAFVPPIRAVTARLEYQLERWADEEAVHTTGAPRRTAARTIAKVALAGSPPAAVLGVASHGVAARANALLEPMQSPPIATQLHSGLVTAAILALAVYQVHHSVVFAVGLIG